MNPTVPSTRPLDVLLVEDDLRFAGSVERGLLELGSKVTVAECMTDGLELLLARAFDCVVIDLILPDGHGNDLIGQARAEGVMTPMLVLTARYGSDSVVSALGAGADDYLVKPIALEVLQAHIRAMVRRATARPGVTRRLGSLELHLSSMTASRDGVPIKLTVTQARLLDFLMANAGAVLSRRQIARHIGNGVDDWESNVVDVHIRAVRRQIDQPFGTNSIETVRGVGYRMRSPAGR